jgi:hypothetical protein
MSVACPYLCQRARRIPEQVSEELMSIAYRHMTPEDEEAVLLLWSEIFNVS